MTKSYLLAAALALTGLISCKQEKAEQVPPAPSNYIVVDPGQFKEKGQLVPVATAQTWVNTYQEYASRLFYSNPENGKLEKAATVNGFTFRTSDLLAALGIKASSATTPHVRGYLGIDPATQSLKIFFVAVKNANLDTIPRVAGTDVFFRTGNKGVGGADDPDIVLDLNYPCPTLCPEGGFTPPPGLSQVKK